MKAKVKTFKVTYDKAIGGESFIIVKAHNENQALGNAKNLCATGENFRNPIEVSHEDYSKPRKQGFQGFN